MQSTSGRSMWERTTDDYNEDDVNGQSAVRGQKNSAMEMTE